jgi:hypothetical protein
MIGTEVIKEICERCCVMEEFFLVVEPGGLVCNSDFILDVALQANAFFGFAVQDALADYAHNAKSLKTIHVNYPLKAQSQEDGSIPVLYLSEALRFIKRCDNPSITQFGCNSRVWLVSIFRFYTPPFNFTRWVAF